MSVGLRAALNPHLFLRRRPPCHSKFACDLQAFTLPEFTRPFAYSLCAVAVVALALLWRKRRISRSGVGRPGLPVPLAGPVLIFAALAGYLQTGHLVTGLAVAVGLLAVGGLLGDLAGVSGWVRALIALPGAAWLSFFSALPDPLWARVLVGAVAAVGAALVADVDRRTERSALGPILLAATYVGVYETVPDPDFSLLLVGAVLPLLLVAWPVPVAYLGGPGAAAASGLLAWSDAVGGRGRLGTVIVGAACLGLLVVEPVARRIAPGGTGILDGRLGRGRVLALGVVQLAMSAICTRIAIMAPTPWPAAVLAALYLAGASAILVSARKLRGVRGLAHQER